MSLSCRGGKSVLHLLLRSVLPQITVFTSGNQPPSTGSVPNSFYSNQPHTLLVTDKFTVCVLWMTSGGFVLPGHNATELYFPSAWPPFAFFHMIITHLLPSAMCGRAADGPGNWNMGRQVHQRGKERKCKVRRGILRLAPGKGALHEWVTHHPRKTQKKQLGKKDITPFCVNATFLLAGKSKEVLFVWLFLFPDRQRRGFLY